MASSNKQVVMMKVLKVDEGVMEMIVEKKWSVRGGEGGKKVTRCAGHAGVLKTIPVLDAGAAKLQVKSDDHMVLPYVAYMKRMFHPRASNERMSEFLVDGSELIYRPTTQEFEIDEERSAVIGDPHDCKGSLFFRTEGAKPVLDASDMEEMIEATSTTSSSSSTGAASSSSTSGITAEYGTIEGEPRKTSPKEKRGANKNRQASSLWLCTSIQSAGRRDVNPLLHCEEIGTGVSDLIPIASLTFARRSSDLCAVAPYDQDDQLSTTTRPTTAKQRKTSISKKGKAEASPNLDSELLYSNI